MIQVRRKKRMGTEGLSFYHPSLLCCLDQMLAVMELSQHLVSSSKIVRPIIPRGARCMGHVKIMWPAVCSLAPHSHFAEEARPHLCMDETKRSFVWTARPHKQYLFILVAGNYADAMHRYSLTKVFFLQATKNPFYLHVGQEILDSIERHARTNCGYASLHNVLDKTQEDRMESFFLSETCKYLYLVSNSFKWWLFLASNQKNRT